MNMQIKDVNGTVHEVDMTEAKRFFHEVRRHIAPNSRQEHQEHEMEHKNHKFHINGSEVAISPEEMKKIADSWWENFGQEKMLGFFEKYQHQAAENIRNALGHCNIPTCEKEVKAAIAQAFCHGEPGLIAEVMFEAMEWCNAYIGLKSIEEA